MKNTKTTTAERPGDILEDLQALVTKAEKLISGSLKSDSDVTETIKERLLESRGQLTDFYCDAKDRITAGVKCTHKAIHENPYQSLAIATGVGVLIGIIAGRRTCTRE